MLLYMAQIDCSDEVLSWLSEMCLLWGALVFLRGKKTWALILAESAAYTDFHNLQDQMGSVTGRKNPAPRRTAENLHFATISRNSNRSNKVWLKVFVVLVNN